MINPKKFITTMSVFLMSAMVIAPVIAFAQNRTPIEEFVDGFPVELAK